MLVPDNIQKCVVFVGLEMANGDKILVGTAFILGRRIPDTDKSFIYVTTARHVIEGIKKRGLNKVFLRFNLHDDNATWFGVDLEAWRYHPSDPTVDVAVFHAKFPEGYDFLLYPVSGMATPDVIAHHGIGCGDEVFIVGLFARHHGQQRNIPIVRIGNIAAMPEEPVDTEMGSAFAYLIEARSIGGLSGSPVFAQLGPVRFRNGKPYLADGPNVFHLLGLIHGHWDIGLSDTESALADASGERQINVGIAIVVPASKILEVIEQPSIVETEKAILANIQRQQG